MHLYEFKGHRPNIHPTAIGELTNIMVPGPIGRECIIGEYALIGLNATVLDKAMAGPESMVGAGSAASPETRIRPGVPFVTD